MRVREPKTVVVRVPIALRDEAKQWQRLLGSSKEVDGWKQIQKLYTIKSKKIYPDVVYKL